MKQAAILWSFLLCLLASGSDAQDSVHVKWTVEVSSESTPAYQLRFTGVIQPGWHLYTHGTTADGSDGIKISFADSTLQQQEISFTTKLQTITDPVFQQPLQVAVNKVELDVPVRIAGPLPAAAKAVISYAVGNDTAFFPESVPLVIPFKKGASIPITTSTRLLLPMVDLDHPVHNCGETEVQQEKGLWVLFLLGFGAGLLALLTPCVFPMIPLTVSFFTKASAEKKRGEYNALLYGFFIFLIYVLLSLPFHFLDRLNPEILNNVSTNVYLNVFFFIVFVLFAFSFFGYYELALPSAISNKAGSKATSGKIAGIFFMALTLAIVSFSCTGPILGSLLAGSLSANGGAMQLTAGMAGFGLALALPFALFAFAPHWLNALPKSGGWLHSFKVILGFIELALAFKFLSNADLVKHWNILKREIFVGLWVIISMLLGLYILGALRFAHDEKPSGISRIRVIGALLVFSVTVYLIPGLTNTRYNRLSLLSGVLPPLYYSIYHSSSECLFDLNCTHDFEEGIMLAKQQQKPVLIDFTGYACPNCRRMEENVWSQPDILELMKDRFIVVSLYVDDKKELSQPFIYRTKNGFEKEIRTVGDQWATFETENFNNNAQPLYVLLDTSGVLLTHPVSYTPAAVYKQWLQCGLRAFEKK